MPTNAPAAQASTPANTGTVLPPPSQPAQAAPVVQQAATPAVQQTNTPSEPTDPNAIVRQAVASAIEPFATEMRTALQQANTRIDQGLQPTANPWAAQVNGRTNAPAVVRPGAMGTGSYSYARVMQAAVGQRSWNDFPLEQDMHHRLKKAYAGFLGLNTEGGVLAPLSSQYIMDMDPDLGAEVRQASIAGVTGMDPNEIQQIAAKRMEQRLEQGMNPGRVTQNLSIYDDTFLGIFLSYAESGEFISLLRPMEIFSAAGARQVQFLANGTFPMIEQTGSMTSYWVGKGRTDDTRRAITPSTPRTGGRNLIAKKLACAIDIPSEFARFGAGSTEAFVRADMADSMSQELDSAAYAGEGTNYEPLGITGYSDILTYEALAGVDGDFFRVEDLEFMVATIEEEDVRMSRPTFVTRPMLAARIRTRRADAVEAMDGAGPFVAMALAMGTGIGYPLVRSTTVPGNLTKGSGTNLTEILCFEPSEFLIARMGVMEFAMTDSDGDKFRSDIRTLRAIQFVDCGPRRRNAFCLATSLIQDDAVFTAESV